MLLARQSTQKLAFTSLNLHKYTHRHFKVLALESSADDTCAAVVTSDRKILSNVVLKQLRKQVSSKPMKCETNNMNA